jgi:tRNA pseudouridine38-40 synthase
MYYICLIEYFGAHTIGWQSQPGPNLAIQNYMTKAILQFTGYTPETIDCAGRTDKGVHALGQVIGFRTSVTRTKNKWITGLNCFLPPFIRVLDCLFCAEDSAFHPRFSAISRTYRYYIMHARSSHACFQGLVTPVYAPIDRALLQKCAKKIIGQHDFSAFQGGGCQAKSSIKNCVQAHWTFFESMSVFQIQANAFLHHMVRYLVGTQLQVAMNTQSLDWFSDLIENKGSQDYCALPQGLYLTHVEYRSDHRIPWTDLYPWFDPRFHSPSN